ncbi:MAG: hypothetical protein EA350_08120 [Gemmatimonadales bacterium]|nr:MAG: hypothetical protein EA350_08120 [Gemmatimonadales bacterium]
MSRDLPLLPTCGFLALLTACGVGTDSTNTSPHIEELPLLSYIEELRIGSVDDPDEGFSRIGMVVMGEDGTLYVLESQAREVRLFGPNGERRGTRGRPGQGPGEFTSPTTIGLVGDTLWVRDAGRQRISWFDRDGSLVHETPGVTLAVETDVPEMALSVVIGDPLSDGFVGSDHRRAMAGGAVDRPFHVPIVRFDRLGAVVDTVRWDTIDPGPTVRIGGRAVHPPRLRPRSPMIRLVGDERIEVHWSDGSGILESLGLSASGDTVAASTIRYEPIPLPAHVRDSLLVLPEGMGSFYGVSDAALASAMASGLDLPHHRPPVRSTFVAADRSVWIELNGTSPEWTEWAVLDQDLAPRGRVTLPPRMTPRYIDGSTLWMVELDELDVPWLVRLRVQGR